MNLFSIIMYTMHILIKYFKLIEWNTHVYNYKFDKHFLKLNYFVSSLIIVSLIFHVNFYPSFLYHVIFYSSFVRQVFRFYLLLLFYCYKLVFFYDIVFRRNNHKKSIYHISFYNLFYLTLQARLKVKTKWQLLNNHLKYYYILYHFYHVFHIFFLHISFNVSHSELDSWELSKGKNKLYLLCDDYKSYK